MSHPSVLVVDDEADVREFLVLILAQFDLQSIAVHNIQEAKAQLQRQDFAFCITDMCLPDGSGIDLIHHMQKHHAHIPVAVMTAFSNVEGAVNSLKAGAFDYVTKPLEAEHIKSIAHTALELANVKPKRNSRYQLIGHSEIIRNLREKIKKIARSQAPVHIYGASGVGKELVARLIHEQGPRAKFPFIPVNCGAIPAELMESEFFGYTKGSFTGAQTDKTGLFQAANGGTLFLDEIADLSLTMQVKLLRAIQERAIRPLGATKEIPVDVRILSATHKDLHVLVQQNAFRQDLFYRINVIEIRVPSLRERSEDIALLAERILSELAKTHHVSLPKLSAKTLTLLQNYNFPGNIRELENILERALTLCEENIIKPTDLNLNGGGNPIVLEQLPTDLSEELKNQSEKENLNDYLYEEERKQILTALEQTHWNKTAAARLLGISFRALRYRLKKLELE